jgi:hypothetical protein
MSIASILAFVLAGAAFKGPRDKADESPTRTAYKALKAELSEVKGERDRQYEANAGFIVRIGALEDAIAVANANARRDQELIDLWRERALGNVPAVIARQQSLVEQNQRQYQQAMAQQAQQNQLAAYQGLGNYQQALGAQMLGAQGLIDAELWCNCVPARHDMLLPRG